MGNPLTNLQSNCAGFAVPIAINTYQRLAPADVLRMAKRSNFLLCRWLLDPWWSRPAVCVKAYGQQTDAVTLIIPALPNN